jgi:hypothetical protein
MIDVIDDEAGPVLSSSYAHHPSMHHAELVAACVPARSAPSILERLFGEISIYQRYLSGSGNRDDPSQFRIDFLRLVDQHHGLLRAT